MGFGLDQGLCKHFNLWATMTSKTWQRALEQDNEGWSVLGYVENMFFAVNLEWKKVLL